MKASSSNRAGQLPTFEAMVEQASATLAEWILGADAKRAGDVEVQDFEIVRIGSLVFRLVVIARLMGRDLETDRLAPLRSKRRRELPLLVVPYMSPTARARCTEVGVAWMDLSGNADITAPGVRVLIDGKPNRFRRPGRVATAFAPKGARVARFFLQNPGGSFSQSEIAKATESSAGHVSKIVSKLMAEELLRRDEDGNLSPRSLDRMLEAWSEEYRFDKHRIIKGVMPVRSGDQAVQQIGELLGPDGYAATGLAGAWFLDHFATFGTATVYLRDDVAVEQLDELGFIEGDRGANTWLVVPNDEGVFQGATHTDEGVVCAHWTQVYLDLAAHPERAKEAAEHLRQTHQNWGHDAS